jgi:PIN domain nuclease of toxin-antitoxin system
MNAEIIPIEIESLKIYLNLPVSPDHRDPFDRILVAQAMDYSLDIVSRDEKFDFYPIQRVWT